MAEITLIAKLLFLLIVANGSPVLAKRLLRGRLAHPLDAGRQFIDGRPILGASKTLRGVLISISATALAAMLTGETAAIGLVIGAASMAGDLLSSFTKRRLGLPPSSQALGLDQIPESLLPALAAMPLLGLSLAGVAIVVALFFAGGLVLSRWLYRIGLREHPY
jgi:CDP-diglyceride synthetase